MLFCGGFFHCWYDVTYQNVYTVYMIESRRMSSPWTCALKFRHGSIWCCHQELRSIQHVAHFLFTLLTGCGGYRTICNTASMIHRYFMFYLLHIFLNVYLFCCCWQKYIYKQEYFFYEKGLRARPTIYIHINQSIFSVGWIFFKEIKMNEYVQYDVVYGVSVLCVGWI